MANPLPKKRCPHDPKCTFGKSEEWLKQNMKPEEFHPSRSQYCSCGNNPLGPVDFERMHLDREMWDASISQVTTSIQDQISKYVDRIHRAREQRTGLYLYGGVGVGKTGAAAVALKEARAWGYTCYSTRTSDLREAIRSKAMLDPETTIFRWCRTVDFLLLDDVRLTDITEKFWGISEVRNLVLGRFSDGLITLITSPLSPKEWDQKGADGFTGSIQKTCAVVQVTGDNRYQARNDILK